MTTMFRRLPKDPDLSAARGKRHNNPKRLTTLNPSTTAETG